MVLKKIFVLGDSISIHYGPSLKNMLEGTFEYDRKGGEELALKDLNNPMGANGGDSGMVLDFLTEQNRDGLMNYDILLLNCGLHDIKTGPETGKHQVDIEKYKQNLKDVLAMMKKAGITVIWVRTTPVDDEIHNSKMKQFRRYSRDLEKYNAAADIIMNESGIAGIDLYSFTKALGSDVFCDHVHFKEEIRTLQAAFIAGYLQSLK